MSAKSRIGRDTLKDFRKLLQKKYRKEEQKFIVEGTRLVTEVLNSDWTIAALLVSSDYLSKEASKDIIHRAKERKITIYEIAEQDIRKLSETVTPQGILAIVEMKEFELNKVSKTLDHSSIIVALENIADPGNVGTILRTCDWFGVDAVLLNRTCADIYNPKVVRATMGALFHLPVYPEVDLADVFRKEKHHGFNVVATAVGEGKFIKSRPRLGKLALVFGNEANGISPELKEIANEIVTIPQFGKAESLNVAVSCGIILSACKLALHQPSP